MKFFGISKETITDVRRNLQKRFTDWKIIPDTRRSHHFTPLSLSQIGYMRTIEDDSFVDIFDFNLLTTFKVDFMHPNGPRKMFNWLQSGGSSYAPMKNIICVISAPTTYTGKIL